MASINLKDGTATGINGEQLWWDGVAWRENTIKGLRESTGKSQKEFSEYFGLPLRTLQEWEQGRANPPSYLIDLLKRILELESQ